MHNYLKIKTHASFITVASFTLDLWLTVFDLSCSEIDLSCISYMFILGKKNILKSENKALDDCSQQTLLNSTP